MGQVDLNKLGELIDGYGGISADDLDALPSLADARDADIASRYNEVALLRDENARLRQSADARNKEIVRLRDENASLRQALAEVELILVGLRSGIVGDDSDILGGRQA